MTRTVVIVGQGPRSYAHNPDAEVWVINGPRFPPRWDVLFQLHGLDHIEHKHGASFVEWLQRFGKTVPNYVSPQSPHVWDGGRRLIMTRTYPEIPAAEMYPLADILKESHGYLTGSFAMAIAYALHENARINIGKPGKVISQLVLDGVMFSGGAAQWGAGEGWAVPCIEYHLGRASAMGVRVEVPPGCGLFAHREFVYGFEGPGCV